jgi:ectoine hydroxylase-related dioxygenase (phytanoyl-CoA dioxygenase family)
MDSSFTNKADELQEQGFCILKGHFAVSLVDNCRFAFLPVLQKYLENNGHLPNRGTNRHFLPMPFEQPCFAPEFFFDDKILSIVKSILGDRIAADQWGCDVPLSGADYQTVHLDYQRPLFYEFPDLQLPAYMLVMSFALTQITEQNGAIELAPSTHRMTREEAVKAVEKKEIKMIPICMDIGDVLIRHPWVLHRGTPNKTDTPRLLTTIRYVRNWYADNSREVNSIPASVWKSLRIEQRNMLRFPVKAD